MSQNDWIFEVGVDTTKADTTLNEFVARSTKVLNTIPVINLRANTTGASNVVGQFVRQTNQTLGTVRTANIKVNTQQAMQQIAQLKSAMAGVAAPKTANIGGTGGGGGGQSLSGIRAATSAIEGQTKAVDFLGKAWTYSLLKFAEYEVIAKGMEGVIHELSDSLKQASDIQFEQSLQKLYSPDVFKNQGVQDQALRSATEIARQYGSDIRDVVQAQGLWTKQTHDLASATYLAAQAEKMHRASGIESLEVYRLTNAMMNQLGGSAADIPRVYDQIAEASLHMNTVLNNLGGKSKTEAFKDLFEGAAESAATLKAMHFSDDNDRAAGTLAIVANQVNQVGESGRTAAKNLTSMFAALEGRGTGAKTFKEILGSVNDYKNFDQVIDGFRKHSEQLFQAYRNGDLGVKPQQYETMQTFLESLDKIKKTYDDLRNNSKGKLDLVTNEQMQTLQGQTASMKASFQALTIAIGQELLPTAIAFTHWLGSTLAPAMAANAGTIVGLGKAFGALGIEMVALQGYTKLVNMFRDLNVAMASNAAVAGQFGAANNLAGSEVDGLVIKMGREQAVLEELRLKIAAVEWQTTGLAKAEAEAGLAAGTIGDIAGGRAVSGLAAFGGALEGLVGKATAILRPLMAIQFVMASLSAYSNDDSQINAALDSHLADSSHGGNQFRNSVSNLWNNGIGAFDFTGSEQGKLNARINAMKGDKTYGAETKYDLGQIAAARKSGNDDDLKKAIDAFKELSGRYSLKTDMDKQAKDSGIDSITAAIEKAMRAASYGNGAKPQLDYNKPPAAKHTGEPTAGDILRHKIDADKRDESAQMSLYRDLADAAQQEIEAEKKLAEVHGWNADSIKKVNAEYALQEGYYKKAAAAAGQEQAKLLKDMQAAQAAVGNKKGENGKPKDAKEHEKDLTNLSMAQAAYLKAEGAAAKYRSTLDELAAAQEKLNADIRTQSDLLEIGQKWQSNGSGMKVVGGVRTTHDAMGEWLPGETSLNTAKDFEREIKRIGEQATLAKQPLNQMTVSKDGQESLKRLGDLLDEKLKQLVQVQHKSLADPEVQALVELIASANDQYVRLGDTINTDNERIIAFNKSVDDMTNGIARDNMDLIAKILGGDEYAGDDAKLKLLDEVAKKIEDINKLEVDADPAQKQQLENDKAILQANVQLNEVLQQQQAIRNSIEYKALQSEMEKNVSSYIDKEVGHLTEHTVYDADKHTSKVVQGSGMVPDLLKSVLGDYAKKSIPDMLDGLFGVKPAQTEQEQMKAIYAKEMTAAEKLDQAGTKLLQASGATIGGHEEPTGSDALMAIAKFPTFSTPSSTQGLGSGAGLAGIGLGATIAQTMGKPTPSTGSGAGSGPNSFFQGNTDLAAPSWLSPGGDAIQVADSPTNSLATSVDGAPNQQKIADNSDDMSDNLKTIATQITQPSASPTDQILSGTTPTSTANGGTQNQQAAAYAAAGLNPDLGQGTGLNPGSGKGAADAGTAGALLGYIGQQVGKSDPQAGKAITEIGGVISSGAEAYAGFQQGGLQGGLETFGGIEGIENSVAPGFGATPIGLGIAAAGGLVSGLLHHDNPADMPDKYNAQVYGQDIANLTGSAGANGTNFTEDYNEESQLGGLDQIQYIEEMLAKGQPSWMTNQQYQQALSTFGASATGAGVLQHGTNIGQVDITGAAGASSSQQSYTDVETQAQDIINQALQKQTLAPIISVNAYGGGPGYTPNPNNMIGLTSSEQAAMVSSQYSTMPQTQYQQTPSAQLAAAQAAVANGTATAAQKALVGSNGGMNGTPQTSPFGSLTANLGGAYATPGVGTTAPGSTASNPVYVTSANSTTPIQVTTQLVVDGQTLASVVNAYNTQTQTRQGQTAA
jgi:hypothetical protein